MREICVNCWVFCIFTGHILSVNIIFYVAGSIFRTTLQALRGFKLSPFCNTFFAKMKYTQCKTKQKNVNRIDPTKLRIEFRSWFSRWLIDGYLWWKALYAIFCFHCRYLITFHCCWGFFLPWNWILQGRGYSRGHISVPSLLIFLYFGYIVGLMFFNTCVKFKLIWVDTYSCKVFVLRNNGEKIIMVYVFKTLIQAENLFTI